MHETSEQYRERMSTYVEGKDFLDLQQQTPGIIAQLIDGVSAQQLGQRPAPDKWSIVEILAHLAEDELTSSWRYRQMIEHDGTILAGLDQELWARFRKLFGMERDGSIAAVSPVARSEPANAANLKPEQWERSGNQAWKANRVRPARHMAAHDINHIQQIERLLAEKE